MEQPPRRLYRSTTNRVLGGVAGGIGEYFNVDPTLIRVAFAVLSIGGGFGILAYIILWIIIPEPGAEQKPMDERTAGAVEEIKQKTENVVRDLGAGNRNNGRYIFGIILVAIGVMALGNSVFPWHWMRWDMFWALVIVAIGISIIIKKK